MQGEPLTSFVRGDYTVALLGKAHRSWKMMQATIYFQYLKRKMQTHLYVAVHGYRGAQYNYLLRL
jgi:hypothetical protein